LEKELYLSMCQGMRNCSFEKSVFGTYLPKRHEEKKISEPINVFRTHY
jgi:hypothetical protein